MARSRNISVQNNFTKGLITEATGLTFPENACTDTDNCTFNNFGLSSRRLGFDFEAGFEEYTASILGNVVTSYLWKNVAGEGDLSYVVVQIGDTLHFYLVSAASALSAGKHADTVDLVTFAPSGVTTVSSLECQFSSGNGLLFVTNQRLDSFYVTYDPVGDTFTATEIDIQIRDFEGDTADPLAVDERPAVAIGGLTAAHRYNLENQGWTSTTLTSWDTARADMPSNADVSWYFKSAADAFDFTIVANRFVGNSAAPRGHFTFNIYNILRSTKVASATDFTIEFDRVNTSAFFAGRVFYAGLRGPDQSSRIFFTQIIEEKTQYGKCYQKNDPTSEMLFDLLPSDGGVIDVSDAGMILKMFPVLNSLIVVATNGVWAITGSQGIGFTANDYTVNKISSITNISHTSFVNVEGIPYWWNLEGIYAIKIDPQTNSMRAESITDSSIRSFMLDIPGESKQFARGVYDQFGKQVQWIYKSRPSTSFSDKYCFDRVLTLNLLTGGFAPWSVDDTDVCINAVVNVAGFSGSFEEQQVVDGPDNVVDGPNNVVSFESVASEATSVIKYFVHYLSGANTVVTFAECFKDTYLDWESFDAVGVEYESFFVTGYAIKGQAIRKFQENYVNVFSDNTVDSSFKMRGQWNFSVGAGSGKWSTAQTFTLLADDFQYKPKKIKLRGHGIACQIRIFNNGVQPFHIIGWSVVETGSQWI